MARPNAQVKLGFYPTEPFVMRAILARLIAPATYPVAILDPSAGAGAVLLDLKEHFPHAWLYGVEMSEEHARMLRACNLTQAVEADAIGEMKYVKHSIDLLWFNPPYDKDDEYGRLETAFFKRVVMDDRALIPGGLFVGVLSESSFFAIWEHLCDYLDDLAVYRFPDPYYRNFKQHVILGNMRAMKRRMDDQSRKFDHILRNAALDGEVPVLSMSPSLSVIPRIVPRRDVQPPDMHTTAFQTHVGYEMCEQFGWHTRQTFTDIFVPATKPPIESLLPLRPTHVGVALAGGLFDNIALTFPDGRHVLVKGFTQKVNMYSHSRYREHGDGTTEVEDTYVEQFDPWITETNLESGQTIVYKLPEKEAPDGVPTIIDADE